MQKIGVLQKKLHRNRLPVIWNACIRAFDDLDTYTLLECDSVHQAKQRMEQWTSSDMKGLFIGAPYQSIAYQMATKLAPCARQTGTVNTLVRDKDQIIGYQTQLDAIKVALTHMFTDLRNKSYVIHGKEFMFESLTKFLWQKQIKEVYIYEDKHSPTTRCFFKSADRNKLMEQNFDLLINASHVGMFPDTGSCSVDEALIRSFDGVFDLIFDPWETQLLKKARRMGKSTQNGFLVQIAQWVCSMERWTGSTCNDDTIMDIFWRFKKAHYANVILIGMPGSGKTSVGRALAHAMGMEFVDTDEYIERHFGKITALFERGEPFFRKMESIALQRLAKSSNLVLSTGGGIVTIEENVQLLKKSGTVIFLDRSCELIMSEGSLKGRPLLGGDQPMQAWKELYRKRRPLYEQAADVMIPNDAGVFQAVQKIKKALEKT